MRVVVFAPLFPPAANGGGPIRTVEALVAAAPPRDELSVIAGDRDLGARERLEVVGNVWTTRGNARVRYVSTDRPLMLAASLRSLDRPDLVYCNGYFAQQLSILPRLWARSIHTKTLIAPRGEFSEAALAIKAPKKRAFVRLAKAMALDRDVIWHASNEREALDIQRVISSRASILIRENDSLLPTSGDRPESVGAIPRLAFVSRLVPNKGLHILLEALAEVSLPWTLDVYGIEEDAAYVVKCAKLLDHPGLRGRVTMHGALTPDSVRSTFYTHDLFPFPTSTENFGHVIAEALSASCPVMLADTTPWTERIAEGGGFAVESLEVESWRVALVGYLKASPTERLSARVRAGDAFDRWRNSEQQPHVFDLVRPLLKLD